MNKIVLIPVEPIGNEDSLCLVRTAEGGKLMNMSFPVYPRSEKGERLRAARISRGISLRDAAARIGIMSSQYSGLETGKYTLSESDWLAVDQQLGPI